MVADLGRNIVGFALVVLAGCNREALRKCQAAYEHADLTAAVDQCSRALKQRSDPGIAAKLAWSLYAAHHAQDAAALAGRYPLDQGLWLLTRTTLDWRAGRTDGAAAALERAADLCRAEGD